MEQQQKNISELEKIILKLKQNLDLYISSSGNLINEYNKIKYNINTKEYYKHEEAKQIQKKKLSEIEDILKKYINDLEKINESMTEK